MDKETKKEFENLARMVADGFQHSESKMTGQFQEVTDQFQEVKVNLKEVDNRLNNLDARMGRMEADLNEIRGNIVYRHEFEDLESRVKYLKTKLGIESGK